jgi:formylglycine-generating enzyme required for sulfatase activity
MFKRRVFVSYSTADQDKAGFLASRLGAEGFEVFFAPESTKLSQNWKTRINESLANCEAFIVLVSRAANESEWVMRECEIAYHRYSTGQMKFLIPIIIEENVAPPKIIEEVQNHEVTTGELQEWNRTVTRISEQIQTRNYLLLSVALLLLTLAVIALQALIEDQFYYVPLVLVLGILTIIFVWLKLQTRSKWLSLILFVPLSLQLISVGHNLGNLRRNEIERANASALALCNAANEGAFDRLWEQFASSRRHSNFVGGLRDVLDNEALSLSSRVNARVALARLGEFQSVTAKLNPDNNTTLLFEFARKPDRWLKDSPQLDWVLTWLENEDPRVVIWGIRILGLAHETIGKFPLSSVNNVHDRILNLLETTKHAGVLNNCRWAMLKLGIDQNKMEVAERKRQAANSVSAKLLDNLSTLELSDIGITLVLVSLPGQQPFHLSDTEITVEQFERFVQETPGFRTSAEIRGNSSCFGHDGAWYVCEASWRSLALPIRMPPTRNLPVTHVSWIDAVQFCNWMSKREGLGAAYEAGPNGAWNLNAASNGYRLPSIKEWRASSKAGTSTLFWWADFAEWQNDKSWNCLVANLPDFSFFGYKKINIVASSDGYPFHAPVKTFAPNDWGSFETIGNVGEWCDEDDQIESCQEYASGKKPRLGGSWGDDLQFVSATSCRAEGADTSHVNVGFRIARSVQ